MKPKHALLMMILVFLTNGCYGAISGTVVDATTGKPIEGAVILIEWNIAKGLPGMTYHEAYKVIEGETDKDGKFALSGTYNPLVDPPYVVVCKDGYVAWRNDYIFPGWGKRTDFKYKRGIIIKLDHFDEGLSHDEHHSFMRTGLIGASIDKAPKYNEVESIEFQRALREIEKKRKEENKEEK